MTRDQRAVPAMTTLAHGSIRCPECRRRFSETPDLPTVDIIQIESYTRRGSVHLGETRQATYRWHAQCREAAERLAEESRERAAAEQAATIERMRAAIEAGAS